jgi:hypothetical protein
VERTEARSPRVVPDGIIANRASVRSRGGLVACGLSLGATLVGLVLVGLPGPLLGAIGFLLVIMSMPTLPMLGVPAVANTTVYVLGALTSLGLWFVIGHVSAVRATRRAVSGWREWRGEFIPLAIGMQLGGVVALAVAAIILGAL